MRKLRLDPESLRVESFEAVTAGGGQMGTVNGHIRKPPAEPNTIEPCYVNTSTCGNSCYGTCYATCGSTCANTCDDYTCLQSCGPILGCVPPAEPYNPGTLN
jgi:hypothetical protein